MQVIYVINKMSLATILAALNLMLLGCAYASAEAASAGSIPAPSEPLDTTGALSLSGMKEMLLYESAEYGIRLSYPAGWIPQEPEPNEEGIILGFLAPGEDIDNPAVYLVLQNDKLPAGQDVTLDQYSQATLRSLKDAMPDLEIQAEREITIGGMAGRAIVYELESEGATFRVWKAWTVVGADAYVFTYNAPVELYDQFAADAAEMIDSFGAGTAAQKAESSGLWAEPAATGSQAEADQMEESTSVTS